MAPRVITASRRTDIPAFYTPWLLRRIAEGFCHVVNPYSGAVSRVSLAPGDVAVFGFFTRDPRPLVQHLPALAAAGLPSYLHMTVNGYPRAIEPRSPSLEVATRALAGVSEVLGTDAVVWRYDPVLLAPGLDETWHERNFTRIASALEGLTRECTLSFVDPYRKTVRNLPLEAEWDVGPRHLGLARHLAEIAGSHGIEVRSCAEELLVAAGIVRQGACVDEAVVSRVAGEERAAACFAGAGGARRGIRPGCGCAPSIDIGAYDTCAFGCAYCYATSSPATGLENRTSHDPADTVLLRPATLAGADLSRLEQPAEEETAAPVPVAQPPLF